MRDHDAALGGAVELGEHEPRQAHRLVEQPGLGEPVLAGRGLEHHAGTRAAPRAAAASITRLSLDSSSIRFDFVCSRPAVSTSSTSARRAVAAFTASKTTAAGSAPAA